MNRPQLLILYQKLIKNKLTLGELDWLIQYFETAEREELYGLIRTELELREEDAPVTSKEELTLLRIFDQIEQKIGESGQQVEKKRRNISLFHKEVIYRMAIAATLFLVFGGGVYYILKRNISENIVSRNYAKEILPGKSTATLTLASGQKIILSESLKGKLGQESGVVISKTAEGEIVYQVKGEQTGSSNQLNTLSTAKGEHYQIILPDGSKVWLNAASSITYPVSFIKQQERCVKLAGEAYFEVAKDKEHPFIVKTHKQEIKVLGTHFNVSAYEDEAITRTTLLEGSVRILSEHRISSSKQPSVVLKPGEQAVLTGQSFSINQVDTEESVAWKNGYFRFNKENIISVMRKLSRWYNIDVIYEGPVSTEEFSGTASSTKPIEQVLHMLQYSNSVHFKVEGRRVTVTK
ncbi:FecR family protein [Pedobacter sp.]|uniref:FecR family protein n=1 Tax=Pedobacter sp. TaxID=1411316 RepID=UPI002B96872B|nr:FecR domain-containing protein [Pedobacter sp.]HWW42417.1 FecR domain-containing protein [Pedobacter sp.]